MIAEEGAVQVAALRETDASEVSAKMSPLRETKNKLLLVANVYSGMRTPTVRG